MTTILLDADIVAYKFAATHEGVWYFDGRKEEPAVEVGDPEDAYREADAYIERLQAKLGADRVVVCLTDRGNEFRKDLAPYYKGNRKGRKPSLLFPVLDHFAAKYETYLRPRLEADDCMGILATHPTLIRGEKVIVSEDKDMRTVPGLLFNPEKDEEPHKISRRKADLFHLWQAVVGDTSDGYPGAYGIGPASPEAKAILASKSVTEAWGYVLDAFDRSFIRRGGGFSLADVEAEATLQARLARILRATDWNFKEKKPILWCPPARPR